MKKSAGRKERRRLARNNRREEGRIKSIINEVEQGGHDAIMKLKRNPQWLGAVLYRDNFRHAPIC